MAGSNKEIALAFLQKLVDGRISEAYVKYASPEMRHHNPYSRGDARSLEQGMLENHEQFPNKSIAFKHVFEDGDLVAVHSHVRLDPDSPGIAAVHILRFSGDKVVEMWDVAQQIPVDMQNENGMF